MNGKAAKKLRKEMRKELESTLGEKIIEHDKELRTRVEVEVAKKQRVWMNQLPLKLRLQIAWRTLWSKL